MHGKLIELHSFLKNAVNKGLLIRMLTYDQRVRALVFEILADFGLPKNNGYEEILLELGWVEILSDEIIDQTLTKLADAGADYLTLWKLEE
jgi:hypothetical protein